MFQKIKSFFGKSGNAIAIASASATSTAILKIYLKLAQKNPKVANRFLEYLGCTAVIIAGVTVIVWTTKKHVEAKAYRSNRLADSDAYTIERMADAMLERAKRDSGRGSSANTEGNVVSPNLVGETTGNRHDSFKAYDELDEIEAKHYLPGTPFPEGNLIFGHGKHGSSKSWLTMQILWNLSMGQNVGLYPSSVAQFNPYLILLYDSELGKAKHDERYKDLEKPHNFRFKFSDTFHDADDCLTQLEKDIREEFAKFRQKNIVVAFDVLASSFSIKLHHTKMHTLVVGFKRIIKIFEAEGIIVTIFCLAHTQEGSESMRGPIEAQDYSDIVFGFFPDERNHNDRVIKITKCNATDLVGWSIAETRVQNVRGKSFLYNNDRTTELNPDDEDEITAEEDQVPSPFRPGSKLASVPKDVAFKMADWYQKGVPGYGKDPTLAKFQKEYGIKLTDPNEVVTIVNAVREQKYGQYPAPEECNDADSDENA